MRIFSLPNRFRRYFSGCHTGASGLCRRAVLLALWLAFGCAVSVAQTNKSIRKLQSQQATLKTKIGESEKLLKSTRKDVKTQLNNLQVLNSQISAQQNYVEGIQTEVSALADDIRLQQAALDSLERDLTTCKAQYKRAVDYAFRTRLTATRWSFILSAGNFRQMFRRMRYARDYSKYQRRQGEVIRQKEDEVRRKQQELQQSKSEKDRLLADGRTEQKKLEGQKRERQQVVDELQKKSSQLQATIAQQKKQMNSLNAKIDRLIQEEIAAAERRRKEAERKRKEAEKREAERRRREQEAARKAAASNGKKGKTAAKKKSAPAAKEERTATPDFRAADNADRKLSANFEANRGRLPVPITGPYAISSHYGQYNVEGLRGVQLDNKGIKLTGQSGAQARSVFDGEVTAIFSFAGQFGIIVRHGSYISVYCNLSSASVRQGQRVSTRQALGTVARDASGNATLHFQLRRETAKLNPESWIGL